MTELQEQLIPKKALNKKRLGSVRDGGYVVCADHLPNYLVSLGCGGNTDFEEAYINEVDGDCDCSVDIYDGYSDCPLAERDPRVTFFRKNVHSLNDFHIPEECFIQCDIEGDEFDLFWGDLSKLGRVKQLCLEAHIGPNSSPWVDLFRNINKSHTLIHIHGNNHVHRTTMGVPCVIELTYVLSELLDDLGNQDTPCPTHLDTPNYAECDDIVMDWWVKGA